MPAILPALGQKRCDTNIGALHRRCIKRALARHFYRQLRELPTLALTT